MTNEPMEDDDRGYSNVLVHTEKGREILESMEGIRYLEADLEKMLNLPAEWKESPLHVRKHVLHFIIS